MIITSTKSRYRIPKWFLINASGQTLGRLATETSEILMGKKSSFFQSSFDQGSFVIIYNAEHISVTGKKKSQKIYFYNTRRPGSLKKETYSQLKVRTPSRIIEKAVRGMLPKGILGRVYFRRLYIYTKREINEKIRSFKSPNL